MIICAALGLCSVLGPVSQPPLLSAGSGRRELEAVSLADTNPLGRDERKGVLGAGFRARLAKYRIN